MSPSAHEEEERVFLHDVANPVATALFVIDSLAEELGDGSSEMDRQSLLAQITPVLECLERISRQITARREVLIQRSEK